MNRPPLATFLEWAKGHPVRSANPTAWEEALAAAALCLRWVRGSPIHEA